MQIQSIYTYYFNREGKYYLFNSLSGLFCEISEHTYRSLYNRDYTQLSIETQEFLRKNKVLINEDEKYMYYLQSQIEYMKYVNNESSLGLVIAPTIHCNFNCPYCFESKSNSKYMSDEVEMQLLDFVRHRKNTKEINLTWYGGEPLLAFDRIKSIWNLLISEFPALKIRNHTIVTNGWLITDAIIDFFKKTSLNSIQITIDGTREHHNKTRCLKNGMPTFDVVVRNIIAIAKSIPTLDVLVRVNISRGNCEDYAKICAMIGQLKIKNITLYPGFIREDTTDRNSLSYDSLSEEDTHEFFKRSFKCGIKTSFMPSKCNNRGCLMNSLNAFIIGPEGEIYKCWNDVGHADRVVGTISNRNPSDKLRLYRYLIEASPFSDSRCKDCFVFPVCSGGCGHYRYRNKFENGKFEICTRFRNKEILEESLLLSIKNH